MMQIKSVLYSAITSAITIALSIVTLGLPAVATAQYCDFDNQFMASTCEHIARTYHEGDWDLYITGYAVHSGDGFTKKRRQELNALAYGGGLGKRWSSDVQNEDLLYAFAFLDSHNDIEPVVGYAHQWFTQPIGSFSVGAGLTIALTARSDTLHYLPFPIALPIVTVRLKRVSVMSTIIPKLGAIGHGTVALLWGRYSF